MSVKTYNIYKTSRASYTEYHVAWNSSESSNKFISNKNNLA